MSSQSAVQVSITHQNQASIENKIEKVEIQSWQRYLLAMREGLERLPTAWKLSLAALACSVYALTFTITFSYLSPDAVDQARKQAVEEQYQQVQATKIASRDNH